jgi:hypothetical protein
MRAFVGARLRIIVKVSSAFALQTPAQEVWLAPRRPAPLMSRGREHYRMGPKVLDKVCEIFFGRPKNPLSWSGPLDREMTGPSVGVAHGLKRSSG